MLQHREPNLQLSGAPPVGDLVAQLLEQILKNPGVKSQSLKHRARFVGHMRALALEQRQAARYQPGLARVLASEAADDAVLQSLVSHGCGEDGIIVAHSGGLSAGGGGEDASNRARLPRGRRVACITSDQSAGRSKSERNTS